MAAVELTIWERHDLLMNSGCLARLVYFLVACSDTSIANVVHDRVIEEHRVLRYNTNLFTETKLQSALFANHFEMEIAYLSRQTSRMS